MDLRSALSFRGLFSAGLAEKTGVDSPKGVSRRTFSVANFLNLPTRRALLIFSIICSLPFIILIRLLRPLVWVRLGQMPSERIGPAVTIPELYLVQKEKGLHQGYLDLFCWDRKIANTQLKKMVARSLRVFAFVYPLFRANRVIPGYQTQEVPLPREFDHEGLLRSTQTILSFTGDEVTQGRVFLQKMGLKEGDKFVCLAERSHHYVQASFPQADYRWSNYRDFPVSDLKEAALTFAQQGFYVFRMGAIVAEPFEVNHPFVIDYATKYRTDFLDIFLLSQCELFFGSFSGINSVPMVFRKPRAVVNAIQIFTIPTWMPGDLYILKKIWNIQEKRFLTLKEIVRGGLGCFDSGKDLQAKGLEVVNNTPAENKDLAIEMSQRRNGRWPASEEDELLQQKFWEIFREGDRPEVYNLFEYFPVVKRGEAFREIYARIGTNFLKQNQYLLE